jgi:dihydropyrimidinase
MTTLIKSGTIITSAETVQADILIDGEEISAIGKDLIAPPQTQVIDAFGKLVIAGRCGCSYSSGSAHVWHSIFG